MQSGRAIARPLSLYSRQPGHLIARDIGTHDIPRRTAPGSALQPLIILMVPITPMALAAPVLLWEKVFARKL